jgi:hypothetical protein
MKKQNIALSRLAAPLIIVCGLLVSSASAMAQPEAQPGNPHSSCTNRTLSGDYGNASGGVLLPPAVPSETPFRSVGVYHFDGNGNFTGVEHTVVNGVSLETGWTANSGTYTVNSDCTGSLVLNTPNSPVPLHVSFIVVRQGSEIHSVLDAGGALAGTWIKVDQSPR